MLNLASVNKKNNTGIMFLVAIFILLASYLRFEHFSNGRFDGDEVYQVHNILHAEMKFFEWRQVGEFTCFKADYFLNYPVIKLFHGNIWGMRSLHIFIYFLGFVPLYFIMRNMFHTFVGYFVTLSIICFNNTLIIHSFEIRPYAVLPTLSLLSYYFWERLFSSQEVMPKRIKIWWGVFIVLMAGFHAYGLFIVFLPAVYHFLKVLENFSIKEVWQKNGMYLVTIGIISFSVWFYYALGTRVIYHPILSAMPITTFEYFSNPAVDLIQFLKNIFGNLLGNKFLYVLMVGLMGIGLGTKSEVKFKILFFLLLIVLAIECVFLPTLMEGYVFVQRQFIWVIPFFAIFMGWIWDINIVFLKRKLKHLIKF